MFISYRRDDSPAQAGRLFDRISGELGERFVFMDVDSIELGVNFFEAIDTALSSCKVLLVIIGSAWLDSTDAGGRRRIDDPRDFVRLEIEMALRRGIRVIPVLIDGATLPPSEQLPAELVELTYRQAVEISHAQFQSDSRRLVEGVARIVGRSLGGSRTAPASINDRASVERMPADPDAWSATRVNTGMRTCVLKVQLTHESHRLEIKIRLMDTVILDGTVIARSIALDGNLSTFSISDGPDIRNAELWVKTTAFDKIQRVRLTVDGHLIYTNKIAASANGG